MDLYWLGAVSTQSGLFEAFSKRNIKFVKSEGDLRGTLHASADKTTHLVLEIPQVDEKRYIELKSVGARFGRKVKFVVLYQTLKPSPVISKLHGSEILLIGPEDRNTGAVLIERFLSIPAPLFRRWQRYQMVTTGSLSLLSDRKQSHSVSILNFCPHGAQAKFDAGAFINKDFVALEYSSHDGKKVRMQSRIVWAKSEATKVKAGIQFISLET